MPQFTVFVKGSPVTFDSPYTNEQIVSLIGMVRGTFAQDLYRDRYRLTPRQMAWAHKLVVDQNKPRPEPKKLAGVDLAVIIELFNHAAQHLKRPAIVMDVDGQHFRLALCGPDARYPGAVYVTDGGPYGDNKYFGRIEKDGTMVPGRDMCPEVEHAINVFAQDPVGMAVAYGHKTGKCCFCRTKLEDARSTAVGYGPICAKHYHLPWGVVAEPIAAA